MKNLIFAVALILCSLVAEGQAGVQVIVQQPQPAVVEEPVCLWGYYSYAPYDCAPYGYYDSAWFVRGIFIGIGPWRAWRGPHPYGPKPRSLRGYGFTRSIKRGRR